MTDAPQGLPGLPSTGAIRRLAEMIGTGICLPAPRLTPRARGAYNHRPLAEIRANGVPSTECHVKQKRKHQAGWFLLAIVTALPLGCSMDMGDLNPKGGQTGSRETIPPPIDLLLPQKLEIHPFTQIGTFEGEYGVHARVWARDAFGDPTKAFGNFRFELYLLKPQSLEQRGARLAQWEVLLSDPERNLLHWDRNTRSYEFKLAWNGSLPPGQQVILVAHFTSRFTERLTTEPPKIITPE